jgi:glycine/D-amino acid oxidase-like deaminating enzyme
MNAPNVNTFSPDNNPTGAARTLPCFSRGASICVVGAGAFGGWTALYLQRKGFNVTLIDAWGAGNSRSSSGDETRVIRSTYGASEFYFNLNVRALSLWKENEAQFRRQVFHNTGVLWLCYEEKTPLVDDSIPFSKSTRMEYEYLTNATLRNRFPLINCNDLHHAYFDPYGGYLKAREACIEVRDRFLLEGGTYLQQHARPGKPESGTMKEVTLTNGLRVHADAFVFACGSWLPFMFPEVLTNHITCTKQEVYYFGVPASVAEQFDHMPCWIDIDGTNFYYGIAGNTGRGFKIGVDLRGEPFDPTNGDRCMTTTVFEKAKIFLAHRFPSLMHAPLLESRVCPYENSPSGNFIFDLHPQAENVFFLGGGSGHGFKHGPALGELVADVMSGDKQPPSLFRLQN